MCDPVTNKEINSDRWQIQQKIGSGGPDTVYQALDMSTKNRVTVKIIRNAHNYSSLLRGKWAYEQIMARCGGGHQSFIPTLNEYENEGETEILVTELVGPSLHSIMDRQGHPFELQSVIPIFKRTLTCIENLHKTGTAHRDIRPQNICVGRGMNMKAIRLNNLGLCVPYIHEKSGMHNTLVYRSGITRSVRYCSFNQLIGGSATRVDDLEALCYSMMWLLTGSLPWAIPKGQKISQAEPFDYTLLCKSQPVDEICLDLPKCFGEFLLYVKSLRFNSEPDYTHLHNIFGAALNHS